MGSVLSPRGTKATGISALNLLMPNNNINQSSQPDVPRSARMVSFDLLDADTIAENLTKFEWELFKATTPLEFIVQHWRKVSIF